MSVGYQRQELKEHDEGDSYNYEDVEPIPQCASNHPNVGEIRRRNKENMDKVYTYISTNAYNDIEIDQFSKKLLKKRHIGMTHKKIIALEGETGAGKSTLVNCLLGKLGLAASNSGSKSCTQVVAEYADSPDSEDNFEARVHLQPEHMIRERLNLHVQNYRAHHHLMKDRSNMSEDLHDQHDDLHDEVDLSGEAKTAEEWCQSLFGDRKELSTRDSMHDLLTSDSAAVTVDRLMQWVSDIKECLPTQSPDHNIVVLRASDLPELRTMTERFSGKTKAAQRTCALWPIVEKIRFLFSSAFLRHGIELVDLPGLSDINADRRNSSLVYLRDRCSAIVIVANKQRAESDPGVDASIKRAIRLKGWKNVTLVLTCIDVCKDDPEDLVNLQEIDHLEQLNENLRIANEAQRAARTSEERSKLRRAKKERERELRRARIMLGSAQTVRIFQSKFSRLTGGRPLLRVVPVSNTEHEKHMEGFDDETDDPPCLSITEDGIRDLRYAMVKLLDEGKMESLRHHLVNVTGLYTSIQVWAQQSRSDRRDAIISMVEGLFKQCDSPSLQYEVDLTNKFRIHVHDAIRSYAVCIWNSKIKTLVDGFGKRFPAASFGAFCNRDGVHKPRYSGVFSMNAAILQQIETDMDHLEETMKTIIGEHSVKLMKHVGHVYTKIGEGFENEHSVAGIDMASLIKRVTQCNTRIRTTIEKSSKTFIEDLQ